MIFDLFDSFSDTCGSNRGLSPPPGCLGSIVVLCAFVLCMVAVMWLITAVDPWHDREPSWGDGGTGISYTD